MNDTIRTEEDVAKVPGFSVLASVPEREGEKPEDKEAMILKIKDQDSNRKIQKKEKGRPGVMRQFVTLNRDMKDDYHYNEAIKTLRTNIQFCGSGIKTIMLTSSCPMREKAT